MTRSRNGGVQRRARKRRGRIFVRMTKWGAILREPPIFLPITRVGVRTMKNTRQRTITLLSVRALDSAQAMTFGVVGFAAAHRSSCQAISQKASSQRLLVTKASRMRSRSAGPTPSASRSIRSRHHSTSVTNSSLA